MVKMIAIVKRREGMSREDFLAYWLDVHGPLAAALPGLRRYMQNIAVEDENRPEGPSDLDGFTEPWFDNDNAMKAAFQSMPVGPS